MSLDILGVSSAHDDFRFIAGSGIPSVPNTYEAQITGGTPTKVEFLLGGQTLEDADAAGGWTAEFDMSSLNSDTELTVNVYEGTSVVDTLVHNVNLLMLPGWFHNAGDSGSTGTTFTATHTWETGYQFDVTVNHLEIGFNTPSSWAFYGAGDRQPLFDLANKRTNFTVESSLHLASDPTGLVTASDFQLEMSADVLGNRVLEHTIGYGASGSTTYDRTFPGGVTVTGSIAYEAAMNPVFTNGLTLESISGTAWVDPNLTISMPLGQARIPMFSIPGGDEIVFDSTASIGLQTANGQSHVLTIAPAVKSDGLGIDSLEMNPQLVASIAGTDTVALGWGDGTAGTQLEATLSQALVARYQNTSGWNNSAPGSLQLSGSTFFESLWGYGQSGSMDLYQWDVADWDFLSRTGAATQSTQTHSYESGGADRSLEELDGWPQSVLDLQGRLPQPWRGSSTGPARG